MVDLIPKEARKTGEGKGSVLVKKGCEIVRWFVSSYSCFVLSFPTSLTVPSQLLFFVLLKLFVQSFLWKAYTYVTRISRFRCLSEATTRIPPFTLTTFAVTSATASGWLSYCKALGEPAKTTTGMAFWTKAQARTNQTQLSNGNKDHRMIPWHQWYNAPRSNIILLCFVLVLFLLLRSHLRSSASFYTSSGSLFFSPLWLCHPSFYLSSGRPGSLAFLSSSC